MLAYREALLILVSSAATTPSPMAELLSGIQAGSLLGAAGATISTADGKDRKGDKV